MKIEIKPLPAGLHFVATPIGAARDITLRALDVLASADVLAAEDTRTLRKLMDIHGIALNGRPLVAYHDHNGKSVRPRLLSDIGCGKSVAYASEAGTPLVADPGYSLGSAVRSAGHLVTTAPGPSAVIAALTVSGLPSDRFLFAGFLPSSASARRSTLTELGAVPATLAIYESPKRLHRILGEMRDLWGDDRHIVVCRELTKKFEEVVAGELGEVADMFQDRNIKGEIVILVDRAKPVEASDDDLRAALRDRLHRMSLKDAVSEVAIAFSQPRRHVYQLGLALGADQ